MEETFSGKRVTVMGLGHFGAGIAATRFLSLAGARVTVTDLRGEAELSDSLSQLADLRGLTLRLGRHEERDFEQCDLVVASPSVRPGNPLLAAARASGVPVTSEIRLFWERCRGKIIGVTGSNGKSTTTQLIYEMLRADGRRTWLGGNIGRSLLGEVAQIAPADWVVLELSSFQLSDLNELQVSPHVAVVTNFTPNHLDWHGSLEQYAAAKQAIFRWQTAHDLAVRTRSGPEADWETSARMVFCGAAGDADALATLDAEHRLLQIRGETRIIALDDFPQLSGPHQHTAALLAGTTAAAVGVSCDAIATGLAAFPGLPHRLQAAGYREGRRFVNDSASTTPESTIVALEAQERRPILIAGGAPKGCELTALVEAIVRGSRGAALIGEVRQELTSLIKRRVADSAGEFVPLQWVVASDSLEAAVSAAWDRSEPGDVILFSPGFASGSMFGNFDRRGQAFLQLANCP